MAAGGGRSAPPGVKCGPGACLRADATCPCVEIATAPSDEGIEQRYVADYRSTSSPAGRIRTPGRGRWCRIVTSGRCARQRAVGPGRARPEAARCAAALTLDLGAVRFPRHPFWVRPVMCCKAAHYYWIETMDVHDGPSRLSITLQFNSGALIVRRQRRL